MKKTLPLVILSILPFIGFAQSNWGNVNWNNGLIVEDTVNHHTIKLGGRFMIDGISASPEQNGVIDTLINKGSGYEFRRVRMYSSGQVYGNVKYKLQFDFAGGISTLKDAYVIIAKIPFAGNFQIGHFKEPVGFELLTSSKYINLMERGLTNALTPERNTGIMLFNTQLDKRMTWALGYFVPADDFGKYTGNKYHLTGRITALPIYNEAKKTGTYKVLHLGVSATHQYQDNSSYTLQSRPESHLLPTLVLAEIDQARAVNQIGGEAALVYGPVLVQSEYITTHAFPSVTSALQNNSYNFSAFYASMSWFITGEHKNYKTSSAVFGRVHPKNNFGLNKAAGAWEVALRYSSIDLEDTDIKGGRMENVTAGINWYLNPVTRFMINYEIANLKETGRVSIFQMRVQLDF